ncbi:hypothetical protein V22_03980 [Calycomorphotria hydatis]|uniref:Uncharacterized protein n=1 Tax=Calycomorphotria hydatis TaxID=2528027 RepID=A0A517T488_9PLAN|nr:hypothetical protein V22_03980 [Calycomorphotria hydatis]
MEPRTTFYRRLLRIVLYSYFLVWCGGFFLPLLAAQPLAMTYHRDCKQEHGYGNWYQKIGLWALMCFVMESCITVGVTTVVIFMYFVMLVEKSITYQSGPATFGLFGIVILLISFLVSVFCGALVACFTAWLWACLLVQSPQKPGGEPTGLHGD